MRYVQLGIIKYDESIPSKYCIRKTMGGGREVAHWALEQREVALKSVQVATFNGRMLPHL